MPLSTLADGIDDRLREAGELLRHAVLPLYGVDRKRLPMSMASAILMEIGKRKLLVSAAHALTPEPGNNASVFLMEGGESLDPLSRTTWRSTTQKPGSDERDPYDIGIVGLDDDTALRIPAPLFLNTSNVSVQPVAERRPLIAVGYPSSRQNRNAAAREYTVRPYVYSAFEAPAEAYLALSKDGISRHTHLQSSSINHDQLIARALDGRPRLRV